MTAPAERIKEHNRGWRQAEPASRSRILSLEQTGHAFEVIDDCTVIVVGKYLLNPAASHWHLIDDPGIHGYLISTLDAEIKRNSPKPATGRDSVAKPADPDRAAELTFDTGCDAESVAGPITLGEGSASLLPVVSL